jgi:adenosylcobinamide-phosphate synthase
MRGTVLQGDPAVLFDAAGTASFAGTVAAVAAASAVGIAAVADWLVGEPPTSSHPVAWFGHLVGLVDRDWHAPRLVGAVATILLPALAGGLVAGLVHLGGTVAPAVGALLAAGALFVSSSLSMLLAEANTVVELSDTDTPAARERLRSLAGRNASELSPAELRSAAVESTAENLADGLFAPLLAFSLGAVVSLPTAAGLAAWVKAVNTMDSMLGYRSKPTGLAPARLDDAVMYVPARVAAVLLALTAGEPRALARARSVASVPSSPNSGWPMATMAAVLDCRLHKPGTYDLFPERSLPDRATATASIGVVRRAGLAAFFLTAVTAGLFGALSAVGGGPWF